MLNLGSDVKIYLSCELTDMRKGINGLSIIASNLIASNISTGAMFVFRGKRSDKLKILWWDGQGFCLFYKVLNRGKFTWPSTSVDGNIRVTKAQLSMLIEGIDWRNPTWSEPPKYMA
jgi:transposase